MTFWSAKIEFTRHASEKFNLFRRHGLKINKKLIKETVRKPELEDNESRKPLKIAISKFGDKHYLRVIYKEEGNARKIITFYPARKGRYESKI